MPDVIAELQASCAQSARYERWLRQRLAQEAQRSAHLRHQLLAERERNVKLRRALRLETPDARSESSSATTSGRQPEYRNAYDAAATCSPVLAQYRHDELQYAHQRCLRRLHRQERRVRRVERERCLLADQFDELLAKYRLAHERLEFVCSRYLELYSRKARAEIQHQQGDGSGRRSPSPSPLT